MNFQAFNGSNFFDDTFLPSGETGVEVQEVVGESEDEIDEDDCILSLWFADGRLGAALFHPFTSSLQVLSDAGDVGPNFGLTRSILFQTNPSKVLIGSRQSDEFIKVVKTVVGFQEDGKNTTLGPSASEITDEDPNASGTRCSSLNKTDEALRNCELCLLPSKDFNYEFAKALVLGIRLAHENDDKFNEKDHFVLLNSLIDFNRECSIRATGALLKFIDTHEFHEQEASKFLSIRNLVVEDILQLDETSFNALQIFNSNSQTSGTRAGSWNKEREGLSIFSLLNHCKSSLGKRLFKHMLRCPSKNIDVIHQRQQVLAFLSHPSHAEFAKYLRSCIRQVKNTPRLLKKLATTQASPLDWKNLKRTVTSLCLIIEACGRQKGNIAILSSLKECGTRHIYAISEFLEKFVDIEGSLQKNRFTVKAGVDEELDEKRRIHGGLPSLLQKIAEEEIQDLPRYLDECVTLYVPQIGYMLAIQPWAENLTEADFQRIPGLKFMFCAKNVPHYKSERCLELDRVLGDTATIIIEHETAIMMQLTNFILEHSEHLLTPTRHVALLDCLLSLSSVAMQNNWTKPNVVADGTIEIEGGRHPLQELCTQPFVANPTHFEDGKKLVVLTGPNACGKSIYIKQVGLVVFLAQLGSWVPAQSATIPLVDQIHTRILTLESQSLGLSAFAVDLNQMARALNSVTPRSLVLVDEFGKGTCELDGQALLVSSLEYLLSHANPFVLVSTHFLNVVGLLKADLEKIAFKTFEYVCHDSEMVFLYKIRDGVSSTSLAHEVAKRSGIAQKIVQRSFDILDCIKSSREIDFAESVYPIDDINEVVREFLEHLDLQDPRAVRKFYHKLQAIASGNDRS